MNNMELAGTLATAPGKAFGELAERPKFWFPLLLTLLSTAGLLFWYYSIVDFEWLKEQMLSANPRMAQMSEAQRERAMAGMSRNVILWSSVIGGLLAVLVLRTLESTYYLLAGNVTNVRRTFKQWFAFSWWVGLPQVIGIVPAALLLLLSDTKQLSQSDLQPLSINELLFHRGMGEPGFTLLSSLTLIHPIVWALTVVGVRVWSGRSWAFSAVFALLPVVVVYGCWAAFAFRA